MKKLFDKLLGTSDAADRNKGEFAFKPRYFIILGLFGILLLLISSLFSTSDEGEKDMQHIVAENENTKMTETQPTPVENEIKALTRVIEEDITEMLNKIRGVTEADVMINLDSTNINIYERNITSGVQTTNEEDQSGGTRIVEDRTEDSQLVLTRKGDTESPVLAQTKRPEIRGVFIVAKGVEHSAVKNDIIQAISSVLDVPSHRISIMPKD